MISIYVYGLDQFVTGRVSRELLPQLAKIYECDEEKINFVALNDMVFHNGVEQTSWHVICVVNAPHEYETVQENVATILLHGLNDYTINLEIQFIYYLEENHYYFSNDEYPQYITEQNIVHIDDEHDECDDDECEELEEGEEDGQIYTGDIFKDFNKGGHDL